MTGEGQQMPMMLMCASMIKHMKGHGMMMQNMMQMRTDMMKVQQKMVEGVKPTLKKEMQKELAQMMERMIEMVSEIKGIMSQGIMIFDINDAELGFRLRYEIAANSRSGSFCFQVADVRGLLQGVYRHCVRAGI